MQENDKLAEQPTNLLWAIDEIIIALQNLGELLKRLAGDGTGA